MTRDARDLYRAVETAGPRFTLGDLILAAPTLEEDAEALRSRVIQVVERSGGRLEVDEESREVVYVVPVRLRAAIYARDARERALRARRAAWRATMRAMRAAFGSFLVVSAALVAIAVVAMVVIAMSRGQRDGGGPTPMPVGGFNADFWYYLWMRDLIELTYWNNVLNYERARMDREYGVASGIPVKPSASRSTSGVGGGGGGGGGGGDGGGDDDGSRRNEHANHRTIDIGHFRVPTNGRDGSVGDEDDEDEDDFYDRKRELTFVESIYAFVFGRGDPNESLEERRWRSVGALLRVNKGCVFAEQVAPFLDSYLLSRDDYAEVKYGLFGAAFDVFAHLRRLLRKKSDAERDASRMHEGYMLEVLTRFGGHAEASDDGRLVYVFPRLQVTMIDPNAAGPSTSTPSAPRPSPVPAPMAPPIYERVRPLWEGGEKMPLVIFLGIVNVFLIWVFRSAGGMDFKPVRQPLTPRAQQTMGRRAGRFRDPVPVQQLDANTVEYGEPPLVILFLELFPKLCKLMMPLLVCYAAIFFLVPSSRALYVFVENGRIRRRNERRKRAVQDALAQCIQQNETRRIAHGKQALDVIA